MILVVGDIEIGTDVLVIGAGPAGYTTAIRLGEMDRDVTLVGPQIGGICLHQGCIPVKALAHLFDLAADVKRADARGLTAGDISVDLAEFQAWKSQAIHKLETGISGMLNTAGVQVFEGTCSFTSSTTAAIRTHGGTQHISFGKAVIATGRHYTVPEGISPGGRRIVFPYALGQLKEVPRSAVVLGGGVAGTIAASVLAKMGSKVILAYKASSLIPAIDDDVLEPATRRMSATGITAFPGASWTVSADGNTVTVQSGGKTQSFNPDLTVICSPTRPNVDSLSLDRTKVKLDRRGFIEVDGTYRTTDPAIYAVGDVLGGLRNASVAFRDGLSVANVLAGKPGLPDYQAVPLTLEAGLDIASAGLSEQAARKAGIDVLITRSPFSANGGAAAVDRQEGLVKVIAEKSSGRVLGVQIVGPDAANLIGEAMLAIETGARIEDVALTLHPHPEITEVFADACARGASLSTNSFYRK